MGISSGQLGSELMSIWRIPKDVHQPLQYLSTSFSDLDKLSELEGQIEKILGKFPEKNLDKIAEVQLMRKQALEEQERKRLQELEQERRKKEELEIDSEVDQLGAALDDIASSMSNSQMEREQNRSALPWYRWLYDKIVEYWNSRGR